MKRILLLIIIALTGMKSFGQTLIDTYSDGNFSATPAWSGDANWTITANSDVAAGATGSNTLRLNVASGAGTQNLRTQIATWGTTQEWTFFVGRRAQAYTLANNLEIWLYGNEADLENATVDGYALIIGEDTGNDEIRLARMTNGASASTIITGSTAIPNGQTDFGMLVRVTRNASGVWNLFTSVVPTANGTGAIASATTSGNTAYINQGSATDNTHAISANGYFGLVATHSSGANALVAVEFDQFYFTPNPSSIAIASGTISAGNVTQGTTNNVLYRIDLTPSTANATLGSVYVTTAGTYQTSDIQTNGMKLRYSTDATLDGADPTLASIAAVASGSQLAFTGLTQVLTSGSTYYLFITADIAVAAVAARTINIASTAFASATNRITFNSGLTTGTSPLAAGGLKTIVIGLAAPTPQALPFTQNFGTTSFSTNPTGFVGWSGLDGGAFSTQAASEASTPTTNASITAEPAAFPGEPSGGLFGQVVSANANLVIATSNSTTDGLNQPVTAINTGTNTTVIITYDQIVRFSGSRTMGIALQYRAGTSGSWTTVSSSPTSYGVSPTLNSVISKSLSVTGLSTSTDYQFRWITWRDHASGSSNTSIGLDNISFSGIPLIALSSPAQTGASNINPSTSNNILSHFQAAITGNNATLNTLAFTTSGTYNATDLSGNFSLFYHTTSTFGSASSIATVAVGAAGTYTFTGLSQAISVSTTGYFWIVANSSATAGGNRTLTVSANPTLTFAIGTPTGSIAVAGTKTFTSLVPSIAISNASPIASNHNAGSTDVVLQRFDLAVTVTDATLTGLTVTTAGTYVAADLINLKVRYSADATLDGGDATLSTKSTVLGAGSHVFPSFTNQTITSGTTGYLFVTADIASIAIGGNTINLASTVFSNISFSSGNKTGTDPVAAGNIRTIVNPSITISGTSPAASTHIQGSSDIVLHRFDFTVSSSNATLTGITVTTAGTYLSADVTNLKVRFSTDAILDGGDATLSTFNTPGLAGSKIFPSFTSQVINSGTTRYIFITADISATATSGNTINLASTVFSNLTFALGNKTGTDPIAAGNTRTIIKTEPTNPTTAFTCGTTTTTSIPLTWTDAGAGIVPDGYLIVRSEVSFAAIDTYAATNVIDGSTVANSATTRNVTQGTGNYTFTSLTAGVTSYFKIYPYTNSGANINYKTTGIEQTSCVTLTAPWEDFEAGSKGGYAIGNVTCTAGSWSMNDALLGTSGSDIKNGLQSVRMRNTGDITMNFNRTNGIGTITVNHAKYSGDANSTWRLDASTDGGSSWTAYVSSTITTSSATLVSQLFTLNLAGNVRFRIVKLSGGSNRINFDDIYVTDYAGCTAPSTQSSLINFASVTGISMNVNWTNGNGAGRVVIMNSSNSFTTPSIGSNPSASLVWANAGEQVVYNGTGSGPISITGLTAGITYYYRVYEYCSPDRIYQSATASNNPNSQSTPAFPTVTTTALTSITTTSASSGGNATADGGSSVTARGIVWDATLNPTLPGLGSTTNGTGLGSYTSSLTPLNPETQYHVRAYATNVNGTGYGSDVSFYTLSNPVDLQAANLIANATSSVQVDLSWDAAVFPSSGATVKGYVLIRATSPSTPTFTATNGNAPAAGVGTIISSAIIDPSNTYSNTGLAGSTTYNYLLVPYCWNGTNPETYNYLTSGALTATATTPPGSCTPPVTSASAVSGILATSNSFLINWTAGSGDRTLVIVKQGSATTTTPITGTSYTANNTFGLGSIMATLEYVCYDGTGTNFTLSGLSASTTYHYTVYTYNSAGVCYKTPGTNQNTTTLAAPSVIETFEPGTKATYANGNNVCALGNWNLNDALIGTSANDRKVGARSARIQNSGSLTMLFDKSNGLGTVTIQHAKYGTDANSTWRMDVSDNGGATFTAFTSSTITTSSTALTAATFNPNLTGNNIRIRITKLSGGSARLNIDQISLGDFVSGNTVTTGVISGSPFCISNLTGSAVSVPFISTGAFNSANVYTAQLSDANGSFSIPTDIGTLSSNANSGTISATIPAGTLTGTLYRIRVVASDPVIVGAQNVANLNIYLNTPDVSGFNAGITSVTSLTLNWTNPAACFDEILIVAKAATSVTASPTGNGSLYTANAAFSTGGSGANLPANEYAVYKASAGTSVAITGLTTGTVYYFEIFLRKGTIWSDGIILTATPIAIQIGDFLSVVGSNLPYTNVSTWQTWNGSSWVAASTYPNSVSVIPPLVSVTIPNGSTVILNSSVTNDPIKNLTVNSGGKLFTNNSTYNGNRYITVYGDITCNGTIGNGLNVYDNISFNLEGNPTTISGTGSFNGSRIRKNFTTNSTTTLIIAMNIGLKFASGISNSSGTVLYNNSASTFNMTLNENSTLNLFTDVGESGNISIDGIDGEGSGERGGTFTINGILNVPGTLFAFTDNITRPINYSIGTSGIINCVNVCTGNSASSNASVQNGSDAAGATLRILNGGKLNMTGGVASNTNTYNKPFSKRSNTISPYAYTAGLGTSNQTYDFQAGSIVEYSSTTGTMPMQSQTLVYSNLLITGAATKTINSTLNVNKDITIESPAIFNCSANNINIGGDWNNYGTIGFTEGSSASITFNGIAKQNIICPTTEDFYNINISNSSAQGVELACNLNIANDLDLGSNGRLFFGSTPSILSLTKMTASSNTLKGTSTALIDMASAEHTLNIGCETPNYAGTFNAGTLSLVNYNRDNAISGSTGDQDVLTSLTYANLSVSGSDNKKTNNNFTVNNSMVVDGSSTVLKANTIGRTLTLAGNFTLSGGATMDDNCRDNLEIITNGIALQTFNGNLKTIKSFNLKSTKNAGGITLTGPNGTTNFNIKNDLAIDFTSSAVFTDNADTLKVGDDIELGSASSSSSNFNFTGTFITTGIGASTDLHISDIATTGAAKAELNHLVIDAGNNASPLNQLEIYPSGGSSNLIIKGNLEIMNGTSGSELDANDNTIKIAGNWLSYNANAFKQGNNSTVEWNGTSLQTLTCVGGEIFTNLTMNNSGAGLRINNPIAVNKTLLLTNGKMDLNGSDLTLGTNTTNATVTGGSASSYVIGWNAGVNGNIIHHVNGNGNYKFPTGDNTVGGYTPADVTFTAGTFSNATLTCTLNDGIQPNLLNPTASTNYLSRYWTIEQVGISNFLYNINYSYADAADEIGVAANMWPYKHNTQGWITCWGATANPGIFKQGAGSFNPGTKTFNWTGLTTFSDFTGNGNGSPLPISLIDFTATPENDVVRVEWSTLSETNNDYYIVERSENGKDFESIYRLFGAGNSNEVRKYMVYDNSPFMGLSYYRLKQTDFDGNFTYSTLRPVNFNKGNFNDEIRIVNHLNQFLLLNINFAEPQDIKIQIISTEGKAVQNMNYSQVKTQDIQIPLEQLANGIYVITISGKEVFNQKFSISK